MIGDFTQVKEKIDFSDEKIRKANEELPENIFDRKLKEVIKRYQGA